MRIALALLLFGLSGCANWSWDNFQRNLGEYGRERMRYLATQPVQQPIQTQKQATCHTNYYGNQATTQCIER